MQNALNSSPSTGSMCGTFGSYFEASVVVTSSMTTGLTKVVINEAASLPPERQHKSSLKKEGIKFTSSLPMRKGAYPVSKIQERSHKWANSENKGGLAYSEAIGNHEGRAKLSNKPLKTKGTRETSQNSMHRECRINRQLRLQQ